jgi:hypothetical protein
MDSHVTASAATEGASGAAADSVAARIEQLRVQQANLRLQKKEVSKALKNARRQKSRLVRRARLLSDGDLLQVLLMRRAARHAGEHDRADIEPVDEERLQK